MSKKKSNIILPPATNIELPDNPWLTKFEYIVKSHLMKVQLVAENDVISNENPYRGYIADVEGYIAGINQSRLWFTTLNHERMANEWLTIRNMENDNVLSFIMQITSEYLFLLTTGGFDTLCNELTYSFSHHTSDDGIITAKDEILNRHRTTPTALYELFKNNPWIVTLTLLNMMNPL